MKAKVYSFDQGGWTHFTVLLRNKKFFSIVILHSCRFYLKKIIFCVILLIDKNGWLGFLLFYFLQSSHMKSFLSTNVLKIPRFLCKNQQN